ncbi:flagellar protein FlhE [Dryocola sp. BD626]|uniref:flagellar protein FlhE n=1 Tax=Dryocola sp. BD626 TaxID=3133273 RepID=UPI003F508AE3
MKTLALVALLAASQTAMAAGGAWSSQSRGSVITRGQQAFKSNPVMAPSSLPAGAVSSRVSWQITPDGTVPPYFDIKLCSVNRCIALPALAGTATLPASFPASGPFHFVYSFKTRGPLLPALTILSNRVTVDYRVGE